MVEIRNGEDWESSYIDSAPAKREAKRAESTGKNPVKDAVSARITAATSKFAAFEAIPTVQRAIARRTERNMNPEIIDPKLNWRGSQIVARGR